MNCGKCKSSLDLNARFCSQCGAPVTTESVEDTVERRHITVMFCDLVESTQLSDSLDIEDLREIVRAYQSAAGTVVERYQGHVAQYLGDGLLIYFGYPSAHEDDAYRSVLAGLDILTAITRLDEATPNARIAVRIGVHSGEAVLGAVGSHGRSENLALGAVPNIAARIQGRADPGQMLLSGSTQQLLHSQILVEDLGQHQLKGISTPISVFRVEGENREVTAIEDAVPLLGRDDELGSFRAALERSKSGRGQVLLVHGEAGIGKSRLHREALRRHWAKADTWLVARCFAHHENETLHPLLPLIRQITGKLPGDDDETGLRKLSEWLESTGHASPALLAFIGDVLGLREISREEAQDRTQAIEQLVEIARHGALTEPYTLVIEDLQWADPSTQEFLEKLAANIERVGICLVLVSRDGLNEPWLGYATDSLFLRRLQPAAALALLDACVGQKLPNALKSDIVSRADGVPLFLEELAFNIADRSPQELADFNARDIPNTIQDSLVARIDAFGEHKAILQSAALLGRNFNLEILYAVTGVTTDALETVITQAKADGIIAHDQTDSVGRYYFRQPLTQQVAYEMPLRRQRRSMHINVVNALREHFPDEINQHPQNYARHLEGAEEYTQAINYYHVAGRKSAARLATAESIRSFRHALRLMDNIDHENERMKVEVRTRRGLSQPLTVVAGFASEELRHNYTRLRALTTQLGDDGKLFEALSGLWGSYCVGGYREETLEVVEALREVAPRLGDTERIGVASWMDGATAFYAGDQLKARPILLSCMDLLPQGDALTTQNILLSPGGISLRLVTSYCLILSGYPDQGLQVLKDILAVCESDPALDFAVVHTLCQIDVAAQCMGDDPRIAIEGGQRVMALSNQVEMQAWYRYGDAHQRWGRAMLGDDTVLDDLEDIIDAGHEQEVISRGHSKLRYAQASLACGRLPEALRVIDEVVRLDKTSLSGFARAETHCLRAQVLAEMDLPTSQVRDEYARAQSIAEAQGSLLFERRALVGMVKNDRLGKTDPEALARLHFVHSQVTQGTHLVDFQAALELLASA